jgi:sialate O-acetylesterase
MNYVRICLFVIVVPLLSLSTVFAGELKFASIFSDHMVLQRDQTVPVWGTADPNQSVMVEFAGQKKSGKSDANGKWMIELEALKANGAGTELKVSIPGASQARSLKNVVVGDVWLASGQSNMEWEMAWKEDSKSDIPNTTHSQLRLIQIPLVASLTPQDSANATWAESSPESATSFSAVGYYFGLKLHQEVGVPIGIIQSAWGGTRIEPWTSPNGFEAVPALRDFGATTVAQLPGSPAYKAKHNEHLAAVNNWLKQAAVAIEAGQAAPPQPAQPASLTADAGTPTALYNAMIHPLVPFALRGAIWYQGESNHTEGFSYVDKTEALLHSWRAAFKNPKMPFYFVQIAPFQYGDEDPQVLPQFWIAQQLCQKIPFTGMAVITDIAEIPDIHPANKKEVARRLALWALAKDYGKSNIDPSSPTFAGLTVEGKSIRVRLDHAKGLASRDGKPLTHFEIAGADGEFVPAEAKLDGESVLVSSDKVAQPKQVRFAWSKLAMPNLMNGEKLPATAFHSHWPVDPDLGENLSKGCSFESSDPNPWGWNKGLTDGTWGMAAPACFATGISDSFPKHVTIDLKKSTTINQVRLGVPNIGSTKTVGVSISADGKEFKEVGSQTFELGKAERRSIVFPDSSAQYVRLTYKDHYSEERGGYSKFFGFTSEVEVYRSK